MCSFVVARHSDSRPTVGLDGGTLLRRCALVGWGEQHWSKKAEGKGESSPPDAPSPRRRHPNSSFQTTKMADDEVAALVVDNGSGMSMSHVQVAGFGNLAHTEGCRPSEPSAVAL